MTSVLWLRVIPDAVRGIQACRGPVWARRREGRVAGPQRTPGNPELNRHRRTNMSRITKAGLLAGASAVAVTLALASPAFAFDTVDWRWDATITETITKNVNIDIDISPTGMTMIESLQAHIGNVKATSTVSDITNNQPTPGGTVDGGTVDFQFHYGLGGTGVVVLDDDFKSANVLSGTVDEGDEFPNINGTVVGTLAVGEVTVPSAEALAAATELGSITSAATAVANNLSIDSDVALQLHIGQFAVGGSSGEGEGQGVSLPETGNSNLSIAAALGALILDGSIDKAKIKAKSTVSGILNATVDSAATAVANNVAVSMAPNGLLIGDVTQLAYADVKAVSKVSDVTLNNYTGLGSLTRPIVSSVATAVGNNASFSVKTPVVAAP
jgi:hypothetical protein